MTPEVMLSIEILLLILFVLLSLRLLGRIIGVIVGFVSWLVVGSLLFGFFIYPDYVNYKDPSIYIKINSINKTTLEFLEKNNFVKIPEFDIKTKLPKELEEEYKDKFIKEYLKKNLPKEILIKNGSSKGKVYIYLSFLIKNPKLTKDALNKEIDKEDLKTLLKGYLDNEIILDPELKNKELIKTVSKYLVK